MKSQIRFIGCEMLVSFWDSTPAEIDALVGRLLRVLGYLMGGEAPASTVSAGFQYIDSSLNPPATDHVVLQRTHGGRSATTAGIPEKSGERKKKNTTKPSQGLRGVVRAQEGRRSASSQAGRAGAGAGGESGGSDAVS